MAKQNLTLAFLITLILSLGACSSHENTAYGTGIGAVAGAGIGAIIGHQSGNRDKGALIGGILGAGIGAGVGNYLDRQAAELAKIAETKRTEHGIITKLKGDLLFDSNSAALKSNGQNNVRQIASIIKKYPKDRLFVVGHTDSQGGDGYNMTLSNKRAKSVVDHLVAGGVPRSTIQYSGRGESDPVADNSSATGRSQNRRVEIEITVPPEKT